MKDVNFLVSNGVNIEKSLELFGDMVTYNDTLNDFLDEIDDKLIKIQQYKEMSDMKNYAIYVHSLKSDARYFGFEKLAEMAFQHETESKSNNIYYVTENYDEFMTEAKRIVRVVKEYLGLEVSSDNQNLTQNVTSKDKAILVVDDSNIVRNFVERIFNSTYEIIAASDGKEAIDIMNSHQRGKIVAMLLDLNMPNIDGFGVLDYMRENNLFREIPVSIITGDSSKEAMDKAYQYPIVDVLSKPFNEMNIKSVVERTINLN